VVGLRGTRLPADRVEPDVVDVVNGIVGRQEVLQIAVEGDCFALSRPRGRDSVSFDHDVLKWLRCLAPGSDHCDPIGVYIRVPAVSFRRGVAVRSICYVFHGVVEYVDVAARPTADEARRQMWKRILIGVGRVAAGGHIDAGWSMRRTVEGVILDCQSVDLDTSRVDDADSPRVAPVLIRVGVSALHRAEIECGRGVGCRSDHEQGDRRLAPDM
jgi:hypothetical protein